MRGSILISAAILLMNGCVLSPATYAAGALGKAEAGRFFGESYENQAYKLYLPSSYQPSKAMPLVVMLHGCTQDPDILSRGTQMNSIAEKEGFIVLFPKKPDPPRQSWLWFLPDSQVRDRGDSALIKGMVDQVKRSYAVDPHQVFVAGMSAGGAMANILGVTYPDVFSGVAICSGLEYGAATCEKEAWAAMADGGPDPIERGQAAYAAMGTYQRRMPVLVFQGTADKTVKKINADQIVTQWLTTNHLVPGSTVLTKPSALSRGQVPNGHSYTHSVYRDARGRSLLELYLIDEMGHAWSGGSPEGTYVDPQGPNASQIIWNFFSSCSRTD